MSSLILSQKWEKFSLTQKFNSALSIIQLWMDRYRQRKQLAQFDAERLSDLGIEKYQVQQEIRKPFWK